MLVVVVLLWFLVGMPASTQAANLCVKSGGSDATAKASLSYSVGNEAGSTCWATVGRAVWGNADRSTPSSGEAAASGDTVYVFSGEYVSAIGPLSCGNWCSFYNPTNEGTVGNPIRIVCVGTCYLGATNAHTSSLFGSDAKDYIEWFADVTLGHRFYVAVCHKDSQASCTGLVSYYTWLNQGVGAGVLHDCTGCSIEGFYIDGTLTTDTPVSGDNWAGVRLEYAINATVKNNYIRNFYNATNVSNADCINLYQSEDSTIEHNDLGSCYVGVSIKDTVGVQDGNVLQYNKLTTVNYCYNQSMTAQPRNDVRYSTCQGADIGIRVVGTGFNGVWYYNLVFYDVDQFVVTTSTLSGGTALPLLNWNTIVQSVGTGPVFSLGNAGGSSGSMPAAASVVSWQHNVYYSYTGNFYEGSDGSFTFANYKAAHTDQESVSPISLATSDPLFVNAAGGDYRLCTGSGTPAVGCSGASPAIDLGRAVDGGATINAGAYLTGTETMGLETAGSSGIVRLRIRGDHQ